MCVSGATSTKHVSKCNSVSAIKSTDYSTFRLFLVITDTILFTLLALTNQISLFTTRTHACTHSRTLIENYKNRCRQTAMCECSQEFGKFEAKM